MLHADHERAPTLGTAETPRHGPGTNPFGTIGTDEIRTAPLGGHHTPRLRACMHDLDDVTSEYYRGTAHFQYGFLGADAENRVPPAATQRCGNVHA